MSPDPRIQNLRASFDHPCMWDRRYAHSPVDGCARENCNRGAHSLSRAPLPPAHQEQAVQVAPEKRSESVILRFGKKLRPTLNAWIGGQSLVPTTPTFDPALLPWTERLQADWLLIQAECDILLAERDAIPPLGKLASYHRRIAPDDKWRSFFFEAHGYESVPNRARCPRPAAL